MRKIAEMDRMGLSKQEMEKTLRDSNYAVEVLQTRVLIHHAEMEGLLGMVEKIKKEAAWMSRRLIELAEQERPEDV